MLTTRIALLWFLGSLWLSNSNSLAQISSPSTEAISPQEIQSILDVTTADQWAALVLKSADQEFPNKLSVVYSEATEIATPREMFPAFFGCFDWHSSVHGHWLLAKLVSEFPKMQSASKIESLLQSHLTEAAINKEAEFFAPEHRKSFERMYGWVWYLKLVSEIDALATASDAASTVTTIDYAKIRENLRPLETLLLKRIDDYLPKLTFPIRSGEHPDTAFALGQIFDYAVAQQNEGLAELVRSKAIQFYRDDVDYPIVYEPSGQDFFSPAWNEADLMRRVLGADEFQIWFRQFLPSLETQLRNVVVPVEVSDQSDGKLVHLAGLNFNRSWCMVGVASALPPHASIRNQLLESADKHRIAGLKYVNSGDYAGDHWLATFALYANHAKVSFVD